MANAWFAHVKAYTKEHNIAYRFALKEAAATWTKKPKAVKVPGRKRGRPKGTGATKTATAGAPVAGKAKPKAK